MCKAPALYTLSKQMICLLQSYIPCTFCQSWFIRSISQYLKEQKYSLKGMPLMRPFTINSGYWQKHYTVFSRSWVLCYRLGSPEYIQNESCVTDTSLAWYMQGKFSIKGLLFLMNAELYAWASHSACSKSARMYGSLTLPNKIHPLQTLDYSFECHQYIYNKF